MVLTAFSTPQGIVPLLEAAVKALGHQGILAMVGLPRAGSSLNIDPVALVMACKRVVGVIEGCANPAVVSPFSESRLSRD